MCRCDVEIELELLNEKGLWGGTYHVVLLALISPHVIYFRVHGRNDLLSVRAAELQVLLNRMTVAGNTFSEVLIKKCDFAYLWVSCGTEGSSFYVGQETIGHHHSRNFIPSSYFFWDNWTDTVGSNCGVSEPKFEYDVVELDISTHDLPNGVS